jgi:poly(3-hydroxybutyrate) depolymerase
MLYQWYETQRAMLAPFAEFASASSKLYNHPLSPLHAMPNAQRVSAGFDLMHRLAKDYEKPAFNISSVSMDGVDVAVQEQVHITKPFCRLLRFKRFTDNARALQTMQQHPTVLLVAPLSGHHATLLRDTVRSLLKDHKVFITDWTDARMVPESEGPFHLNDYVKYIQEFIRALGPNVHVISVCQPTVPVLAAISLLASKGEKTPLTMTMMGGPIDARRSPTAVNNLATNKSHEWFEHNVIYRVPQNFAGANRRVYPGFLQHSGFVAMNPDRHLSSHYDYFLFALMEGTWRVDGQLVKPQDIKTTALLTIEGELDDISGAGQTKAAHDLCTGVPKARQQHHDVKGAGHYGIFAGRRWRDDVYPAVRDFIRAHNVKPTAASALPLTKTVKALVATQAKPSAAKKPTAKKALTAKSRSKR